MSQTSTFTVPVAPGAHSREPSCNLESINQDVITSIIVELSTSSDLINFINSSPIVYHCFLEEKAFVLLRYASRGLGQAIRDAVVLAQTERLDLYGNNYYKQVGDAVKEYRHRLYEEHCPIGGVDAETAVRVMQINRRTQFFVDLWASAWLDTLRGIGDRVATPLTTRERHRFSQALIRLQFLTRIYPTWNPPTIYKHNEDLVFDKFFDLFKPCELEQISEAAALILNICEALMQCEAVNYSEPPILCDGDSRRSDYFDWFYWDLEAFRKKIIAASSQDGALLRKMHDWLLQDENHHMPTLVAPLAGSHLYRRHPPPVPPPERLFGNKDDDATITSSTNELNQPYGWMDALDGRDWPLWGMDLLQTPRVRPSDGVRGAKGRLEQWRWMGFVFWDRGRVEAMKSTDALSCYQTGWLVRLRGPPAAFDGDWQQSQIKDGVF